MKAPALIHRRLVLALATAVLACGAPPEREVPNGDPRLLGGTWELTLRRGKWTRFVPVGGEATTGRVVLLPSTRDSIPVDMQRRIPCRSCLRGSFRLGQNDWFPAFPRGDSASAAVFTDGYAMILLQVAGNCYDCGNLLLAGHIHRGRVKGGWGQEFLGMRGLSGTFVLRRLPVDPGTGR